MWPTIVSCEAYRCVWNRFDIKTKVGSCGKLMIQLNEEGKCVELAKYVIDYRETIDSKRRKNNIPELKEINRGIEPGIYELETDISEMTPDQIEATKNLKPGTHL